MGPMITDLRSCWQRSLSIKGRNSVTAPVHLFAAIENLTAPFMRQKAALTAKRGFSWWKTISPPKVGYGPGRSDYDIAQPRRTELVSLFG
jgi:hypothetical protein